MGAIRGKIHTIQVHLRLLLAPSLASPRIQLPFAGVDNTELNWLVHVDSSLKGIVLL